MKDYCIFKAAAPGRIYRVESRKFEKAGITAYYVRTGRRLVKWPYIFYTLNSAIDRATELARIDAATIEERGIL